MIKTPSTRIGDQDWQAIEVLLSEWFSLNLSRTDVLPFRSSLYSPVQAMRAAAIFKRGAAGVRDLETEQEFLFPPRAVPRPTDLSLTFDRWDECLQHLLDQGTSPEATVVIADSRLAELHPVIEQSCAAQRICLLKVDSREELKSLSTVRSLCAAIPHGSSSAIIAGGGLCCDVAAFAAAICGLKITLIPTTILALADAGLGGKTAVNDPFAGKNQVGLFAEISSLIQVREFLFSLPRPLVLEGLGEILKHAWLCGEFSAWKPAIQKLMSIPPASAFAEPDVHELLNKNQEFKQIIVNADPHEAGVRVMLNLGHTVAHLLEALSLAGPRLQSHDGAIPHGAIPHGVAVTLGLQALLKCALLNNPPDGFESVLDELLSSAGLRFPLFAVSHTALLDVALRSLAQDKKNTGSNPSMVRCVLPSYGALSSLPDPQGLSTFIENNTKLMNVNSFIEKMITAGVFL